jgi:dihydroorotate dehydrogenase
MTLAFSIEPHVMNAACSVAKTPEDVAAMANTNVGAILVGSITVEARDGNPEPRWFPGKDFSLNSFGMPNGGMDYYSKELPGMIEAVHALDKKFVLSIAGFNAEEYGQLAALANKHDIDYLELNLGCPNVSVDGKQKPIASFDVEYIQQILEKATSATITPLLIKLSPYSNPAELQRVAAVLATYDQVVGVVTSNTFPNSFMSADDNPVLANVYGGMSGKALMPIALGQVKQFRDALPERIAVIGAGGIETFSDVNQFLDAGASAIQSATLIVRDGHSAINQLTEVK